MNGTLAFAICCPARVQALACATFLRRQGVRVDAPHHVAGERLPWRLTVHVRSDATSVGRPAGGAAPDGDPAPIDLLRQAACSVGASVIELEAPRAEVPGQGVGASLIRWLTRCARS